MDVNNNLHGLQQLFAAQQVRDAGSKAQPGTGGSVSGSDEATLSSAASLAAQSASGVEVRIDKVTAVAQALAAGTYSVPSSHVADKMIESMLGN